MSEETLFQEALARSPEERPAFLNEACAGQPELRAAVEALLAAHAKPGHVLDQVRPLATGEYTPQPEAAPLHRTKTADYHPNAEPGTVIAGRYVLQEKIGEGGMGEVWVAKQTEPVKRRVALKVIKTGMDSKAVVQRFEQERQALALMDHPNIARVLDGGLTGEPGASATGGIPPVAHAPGSPFFVMELVNGLPLTKFCDDAKLTPRERLGLFVPICQAVQHAHQKGIVHRDLKPANILVTLVDGKPVPKVIDFGVAKAIGGKLLDESLSTQFGAVVGTLEYMAPEQAGFSSIDVDTRADVYSLGVILYELLTGLKPHDSQRLRKVALAEMIRIIQEEEPSKPSTRLSTDESLPSLAALRQTEPKKLMAMLRGELDWVVMKCLEKQRDRRYETASSLARDVQRHLADEPVEARPPSARYRLGKFLRRNKAPVVAASLVLLALVAGMSGTTWGLVRALRAEAVEAEQRKLAEEAEVATLLAYQSSTDDAVEHLIGSKTELGPKEKAYLEKALERWQAFADRKGDDERGQAIRGRGHFNVAHLWARLGRTEEARAEYEVALAIRKKLVEQSPAVPAYRQDLAGTHNNLGIQLDDLGEREKAWVEYEAARAIRKQLVEQFPAVAAYHQDVAGSLTSLGGLLAELGKREEARAEYHAARDIQMQLVGQFPAVPAYQRELATTHVCLGKLLAGLAERDEARAEYLAARNIQQKLVEQFPAMPAYQRELASTHNSLGALLFYLGKREEARAESQAARDIQKKLVEQFPAMPAYQQDLASTHSGVGALLDAHGKREEARAEYEVAREILKKLVVQFPTMPAYQQHLATTHNNLGNLLANLGKGQDAQAEYQAARDIEKKLVEQSPAVPAYRIALGGSYCNHGLMIRDDGNSAESLEWFDLAIQTLNPVHEKEPRDVTAKLYLRNSHWGRAKACDRLQKFAEAVKDWERAIELSPPAERPRLRAGRAISQIQAGMVAEAVAEVAELSKLPGWNAGHWYDFASVYAFAAGKFADKKLEYAERAMDLLQQAVKAGYKDAGQVAKNKNLDVLRGREDFKQLLAELEKSLPDKPEKQP